MNIMKEKDYQHQYNLNMNTNVLRKFSKLVTKKFNYRKYDSLKGTTLLNEEVIGTDYEDGRLILALDTGKGYGSGGRRYDYYIKNDLIYKISKSSPESTKKEVLNYLSNNNLLRDIDHLVITQELD